MSKETEAGSGAVVAPVEPSVRPLSEPLFLLHCGALFGGERDDWDVEANSGRAVDELADQHPGETLRLYALSTEDVAVVNKHRARKVWQTLTEAQKAKLQRIGVQRLRDWLDRVREPKE